MVDNILTSDKSLMSVLSNGLFTEQCCELSRAILLAHEMSHSHIFECIVRSIVTVCSGVVLHCVCCVVLCCIVL